MQLQIETRAGGQELAGPFWKPALRRPWSPAGEHFDTAQLVLGSIFLQARDHMVQHLAVTRPDPDSSDPAPRRPWSPAGEHFDTAQLVLGSIFLQARDHMVQHLAVTRPDPDSSDPGRLGVAR